MPVPDDTSPRSGCNNAVYPNAVFRPIFESPHDALDRPESRPGFEVQGNIYLGLRIIVVTLPFASIVATDNLANVGADCK